MFQLSVSFSTHPLSGVALIKVVPVPVPVPLSVPVLFSSNSTVLIGSSVLFGSLLI